MNQALLQAVEAGQEIAPEVLDALSQAAHYGAELSVEVVGQLKEVIVNVAESIPVRLI